MKYLFLTARVVIGVVVIVSAITTGVVVVVAVRGFQLHASHFASVVRTALGTLESNKMVRRSSRLTAVLTVYVAPRVQVGLRHGLHPPGRVQQRKVIAHVFHGPQTERTLVRMAPRAQIIGKALQVHNMSAPKTAERFRRLKQSIVTDGTLPLQLLRQAVVRLIVVIECHARVALHAVSEINAQSQSETANVTVGTMKNRSGTVVVQVTYPTKVLGKGSLFPRLAIGIDAAIFGRL